MTSIRAQVCKYHYTFDIEISSYNEIVYNEINNLVSKDIYGDLLEKTEFETIKTPYHVVEFNEGAIQGKCRSKSLLRRRNSRYIKLFQITIQVVLFQSSFCKKLKSDNAYTNMRALFLFVMSKRFQIL